MTIDVKNLKSRAESVTDLLDDYCQQECKEIEHQNCFGCSVRRAMFEAQSMRLYLSITMEIPDRDITCQVLGDDVILKFEEVQNDIKPNSSRS